jgi:hypothetical protein
MAHVPQAFRLSRPHILALEVCRETGGLDGDRARVVGHGAGRGHANGVSWRRSLPA